MNVQSKVPVKGQGRPVKKTERLSQEEVLQQLLEDHKKSIGEVICIKIDDRTFIELPASLSVEDREKRVNNYIKNMNFKPVK